jgi:hypothetical protein
VGGGSLSDSAAAQLPAVAAGESVGSTRLRARVLRRGLARVEYESLWLFVLAAFALLLAARLPVLVAPDTWLALVGGREIVEHGIPRHDALSIWSAGTPWVDQQWLGQLAIYGAVTAGGLRLALLLHVGLLVVTLAAVLVAARRMGASPRSTAVGGAICLLGAAGAAVLRGQTLALPLFALLLWLLLTDARAPSNRVLLTLPLLALWANLHGTALIAAVLVALRGIDSLRRRPRVGLALLAGGPAALLASPYTFSVIDYYGRTIGNRSFSEFVTEWAPPSFPSDWRVFLLAAVSLWLVSRHSSLMTNYEKVVFAGLLVAAIAANRNAVWLALFCGLVLPRLADAEWPPTIHRPPRRLNAVTWAVVGLLLAAVLGSSFSRESSWYEQSYPAGAADRVARTLRAEPAARVFSSEVLADWLLWKVPEARGRIAFDVRFELLSRPQLVHMSEFVNAAEGWRALLNGYRVVVLDLPRQSRNERALRSKPGARRIFRDDRVAAFLLEGS